jgi:hypothetical protein
LPRRHERERRLMVLAGLKIPANDYIDMIIGWLVID